MKIFLVSLSSVAWAIVFYNLTVYLIGLPQDRQIIQGIASQVIDFESFAKRNTARPLQISGVELIYTGNNRYDFVAPIANPNLNRGVIKLVYQFAAGSYVTPTATAVLLPAEHNYLISLANVSPTRLNNASLKIISQTWESLWAKANYPQPVAVVSSIASFNDSKFSRLAVDFKAENLSSNNFWEADFNVILFSNNRIVGANRLTLERFLSGETREAEVNWYDPLPRISKVEVAPMIDVYNSGNIFQIPGQPVSQ